MNVHSTVAALDPGLAETIERRAGLRLGGTRRAASETAVQRAMAAAGAHRPDDYLRLLERNGAAFEALLGSLTVGETFFFRERAQFELLRHVILPDVVSRRGGAHAVQVWSAGCSTGEEAYSLAMVLAQGGVEGRVLGTDLCPSRLARAKGGVYGAWSLRGVAPGELDDFLEPAGKGYRVRHSLAQRVAFAPANLLDGPPGRSRFDVVFCRNVLIYLTPDAVHQAIDTLLLSLTIGGWLVLASSDPHLAERDDLVRVRTPHGIAYRRARHGVPSQPVPHDDHRRSPSTPSAAPPRSDRPAPRSPSPSATEPAGAPGCATGQVATPDPAAACASEIRELADRGRAADALERSEAAVRVHPTAAELHYLRALLHLGAGRLADALAAADSALYLRGDVAVVHVLRAQVTRRLGDVASCQRSLRNARRLLAALPPDAPVPMGEGERVDALLAAVDAQLGVRGMEP